MTPIVTAPSTGRSSSARGKTRMQMKRNATVPWIPDRHQRAREQQWQACELNSYFHFERDPAEADAKFHHEGGASRHPAYIMRAGRRAPSGLEARANGVQQMWALWHRHDAAPTYVTISPDDPHNSIVVRLATQDGQGNGGFLTRPTAAFSLAGRVAKAITNISAAPPHPPLFFHASYCSAVPTTSSDSRSSTDLPGSSAH